jgi:glycosyltransferase involved in cell wall biosynthesis
MIGAQSAFGRGRGIGRYSNNFVAAAINAAPEREFVLYFQEDLPVDPIEGLDDFDPEVGNDRIEIRRIRSTWQGSHELASLDDIVATNPDGLDLLCLTSPFDPFPGFVPPARPVHGLKLASVIHDLIPFAMPAEYQTNPAITRRWYQTADILRRYDLLLGISEATRRDCIELLGVPEERAVNVLAATDASFHGRHRIAPDPKVLAKFGIRGPYVFCVGGLDPRKNNLGVLEAFAALPQDLRPTSHVVLTCSLGDRELAEFRRFALARGILPRVVFTNFVDDEILAQLYRQCSVFAFLSHYEGFGLPILEAMHCGAPVLAGRNSSQIEVAGEAGRLVDTRNTREIAAEIERILRSDSLRDSMAAASPIQAAKFTWEETGRRTESAFKSRLAPAAPRVLRSGLGKKPRIAVLTPLPPLRTGVAEFARPLLDDLLQHVDIDVFHDEGTRPHLDWEGSGIGVFDYRLYARRNRVLDYHATVFEMGNSGFHKYVYETAWYHRGIVAFHDIFLVGFHTWYQSLPSTPDGFLAREFAFELGLDPGQANPLLRDIAAEGELAPGFLKRRMYFLRRLISNATGCQFFHSWCRDQAISAYPDVEAISTVIPMGVEADPVRDADRRATRRRFGLPEDGTLFGSFGIMSHRKGNLENVRAFADLAKRDPSARLVFVGPDDQFGEPVRAKVKELGLADRVRVLGHQGEAEFDQLLRAMDVGLNLREAPTHGEVGGSLVRFFAAGIPVIVSDCDTFSSWPDAFTRKVPASGDFTDPLRLAMTELLDPAVRAAMGTAAMEHVRTEFARDRLADRYATFFDECRARELKRRRDQRELVAA